MNICNIRELAVAAWLLVLSGGDQHFRLAATLHLRFEWGGFWLRPVWFLQRLTCGRRQPSVDHDARSRRLLPIAEFDQSQQLDRDRLLFTGYHHYECPKHQSDRCTLSILPDSGAIAGDENWFHLAGELCRFPISAPTATLG
jgi:hypothetical protein